jgi:hypothetical protein
MYFIIFFYVFSLTSRNERPMSAVEIEVLWSAYPEPILVTRQAPEPRAHEAQMPTRLPDLAFLQLFFFKIIFYWIENSVGLYLMTLQTV